MSLPSRSSGGLQGLSWAGPYQSLCPYFPLCPEKTFFAVAKWITSGSQMHYAPSVIWLLLYILLSALDPCLIPPYTSSKQIYSGEPLLVGNLEGLGQKDLKTLLFYGLRAPCPSICHDVYIVACKTANSLKTEAKSISFIF